MGLSHALPLHHYFYSHNPLPFFSQTEGQTVELLSDATVESHMQLFLYYYEYQLNKLRAAELWDAETRHRTSIAYVNDMMARWWVSERLLQHSTFMSKCQCDANVFSF